MKFHNFRGLFNSMLDFLNGSHLSKNVSSISKHFFNYNSKENTLERKNYLKSILTHSIHSVPYYSNFRVNSELQDFPIVNKLTFIDNKDSMLSSQFAKESLYKTTTSGSTGTPFTILKNKGKVIRHKSENIFFSELANYFVGNKLFYTRVWNNVNQKSKLEQLIYNIVPVEISNLSDNYLTDFINLLNQTKEENNILGFSSFFEVLAQFIQKNNLSQNHSEKTKSIITMSETLPSDAKVILESYFNCKVYSRYSNMENGFIAQQYGFEDDRYLVNHGSFLIEIIDLENDRPVPYGTLGRIVVTDYFNKAMPFIRYDTGDLGIMQLSEDSNFGPYIKKVEGRVTDFITNSKGELLSPHTITNTMWRFNDLKQFQFIQSGPLNYVIKINYPFGNYPRENELLNCLKEYLGQNALLNIEYVDEIPPLNSGKRKKIMNLTRKNV